ncbi:glycosyltransferase family 4 protein [Rhodocaloribacter litoris]|uniref:glycosyltransferase family 4 protein n=1 Tax=Rhodocaloribacter litoris TaxID=2558931 RepID=UPI00141DD688|nr:glycosyltransferase family 4 protein [Rhodocaloribacter litoris]QXD14330.1 glycosyltransferase family 4 protein [Rhodocaloribacter litoris]
MHLAVFFQYYHNPDCPLGGRHYAFIREWAQRHTITLITTRLWQDRRLSHRFDWVPEGVVLHALDVPYDNTMEAGRRTLAFARYAAKAVVRGLSIPRPDVILGSSTPLTAAWAAATVARLRGIPWVFEVRDLWPDFPVQMGAIRSPRLRQRLYAMERRLYDAAAHVVTLSPDMAGHVRACGVPPGRVTTIHQGTDFDLLDAWTDEDLAALRRAHGLEGRRVVLYAGSFGRANDLPALLEAAARLAPRDDLRFVFTGHGYHADDVAAAARRHGHLLHLPPQPRHRMLGWFRLADLSVVSFLDRPVLAANAPAKLCDSLGAATPVIVTNPGWTKRLVEEHGCGWYAPPSDPAALARTIETALADPAALAEAGRRGRTVARNLFDRTALARQFETLLAHTVQTSPYRAPESPEHGP